MKNSLLAILLIFASVGCATTNSENVEVYTRDDVFTENSKVIVFPMLIAKETGMESANTDYSNPLVDALLGKKWSDSLGTGNTIVLPKIALDKIPNAYDVMETFIGALDTTSVVEQSKISRSLTKAISNQFGDGAFALALAFQDEAEYDSGGVLSLNMGLFDTKKMTWKWITKHSYKKSLIPVPYQKVLQDLVDDSYSALKEQNEGKVI